MYICINQAIGTMCHVISLLSIYMQDYIHNIGKNGDKSAILKFDPAETSPDSWKDCSECMCKMSENNSHLCWRCSSGRTNLGRPNTKTERRRQNYYLFCGGY